MLVALVLLRPDRFIGGLFDAAFEKEIGEHAAALFGEEAGGDFELVVELRVVHDGED